MTLEERLYNGNRAKEVLDNEQYQAAFQAIEKELIDQWMSSNPRSVDARERSYLMLQLLKKVQTCLQQTLETGKLAQQELAYKQSVMEKLKAGVSSWSESVA